MHTRQQLADLWQRVAQVKRRDIFGDLDDLRPDYEDERSPLVAQIDLPRVGMVGPRYSGRLVVLSVSPGEGKANAKPRPHADRMYEAIRRLRAAAPGAAALAAFEAQNDAAMWALAELRATRGANAGHRIERVRVAAGCGPADFASLTVVPFRTRDDTCSLMFNTPMGRDYLDAGYEHCLGEQLRALAPAHIVALDRAADEYARRYAGEAGGQTKAHYLTGGRGSDAEAKRGQTIAELAGVC